MQKNIINVVSMGPGHKDYILPCALKAIRESSLIIGSSRHLKEIALEGKEILSLKSPMEQIIKLAKKRKNEVIAFLVSGDAGFHSLLGMIKKEFDQKEIKTHPGISSIHYLFAKENLSWEKTAFLSLHGKGLDVYKQVADSLRKGWKVALLTDQINTPQKIGTVLSLHGFEDNLMITGNNLSYPKEEILRMRVCEYMNNNKEFSLCVVVILV